MAIHGPRWLFWFDFYNLFSVPLPTTSAQVDLFPAQTCLYMMENTIALPISLELGGVTDYIYIGFICVGFITIIFIAYNFSFFSPFFFQDDLFKLLISLECKYLHLYGSLCLQ